MYQIQLEKFQGPLDLLLQLIEQEELDITEVSLAQVTDQYLSYIKQVEELNPAEVADFLVIAAKLLLIKSRLLLPSLQLGGEEEAKDLERQLKIYKEYLEAGKFIQARWRKGEVAWVRTKPILFKEENKFSPPPGLNIQMLHDALGRVVRALEPIIRLPEITLRRAISIQEKIIILKNIIQSKAEMSWKTIMSQAADKTEIIVSFLALLELVKQKYVSAEQSELFQDISISRGK